MNSSHLRIIPLKQDPSLVDVIRNLLEPAPVGELNTRKWPRFEFSGPGIEQLLGQLLHLFPSHQFVAMNTQSGKVVGCGLSVPFHWKRTLADLPTGWDDVLARGIRQAGDGLAPNDMSMLLMTVLPEEQERGIANQFLEAFRNIARAHGHGHLLGPVRPLLKMKYPQAAIQEYFNWQNKEGKIFDPWLRFHHQAGGRYLAIAPHSVTVEGTLKEWEEWTGLQFPVSGDYVVPSALSPVSIDLTSDQGVYRQPNVWVVHQIDELQQPLGTREFPIKLPNVCH